MSLYYVVKLFQDDPRTQPDYLGPRRDGSRQGSDEPLPLGVVSVQEAKRFLWQEEADAALRQFMNEHGGDRIVRGQVYHVKEEPVGPSVKASPPVSRDPTPPEPQG